MFYNCKCQQTYLYWWKKDFLSSILQTFDLFCYFRNGTETFIVFVFKHVFVTFKLYFGNEKLIETTKFYNANLVLYIYLCTVYENVCLKMIIINSLKN